MVATRASDCSPGDGAGDGCTAVVVRMADGPRPARDLVQIVPVEPASPRFAVGDRVVLGWSGGDPDDPGSYQIVDFQRGAPLIWLAARSPPRCWCSAGGAGWPRWPRWG